MEINQYFKNYINNLQKEVFLLAYDFNYEIVEFITFYMKSKIRKEMDKPYSNWHNQPAIRILEEVLSEGPITKVDRQKVNKDAVEWLGFFYSKWHFLTGESSKTIIRFLSPVDGLKRYYTLHQLDEKEAIEIVKRQYNISRNNHRKNEYKNKKESNIVCEKIEYYSFLAIRLLYKLTREQIYKKVIYVADKNEYDFVSNDYSLGISTSVLLENNNKSIIDQYKINDELASRYFKKCLNSIYFCFIFSDYYEIDDSNDAKLIKDIKEIKSKFSPNNRQFKYLYFYKQGKLYEITQSNELYIYSIPTSNRERIGVINEMKKYCLL